jgi:prevent-host-death family protein
LFHISPLQGNAALKSQSDDRSLTTLAAHRFSRDVGRAKRAAKAGPVLITSRGKPTHVLLSYSEYQRLAGMKPSILELLSQPGGDFEFEPSRLNGPIFRPVEFD